MNFLPVGSTADAATTDQHQCRAAYSNGVGGIGIAHRRARPPVAMRPGSKWRLRVEDGAGGDTLPRRADSAASGESRLNRSGYTGATAENSVVAAVREMMPRPNRDYFRHIAGQCHGAMQYGHDAI